jgi:hypothetical protein
VTYRALLWLYPPRFRREYGAEMALLFADLSRDAEKRHGAWGVLGLLARVVLDTIYNSIGEWTMTLRKHGSGIFLTLTGFAALAAVWFFMFTWTTLYTWIILAPWYDIISQPPEGSLAQAVNDLFEGSGAYSISFAVLAINAVLFARMLRAGADAAVLPWKFAFAGLVFIVGSWALIELGIRMGAIIWPHPSVGHDIGFHRSVFPGLMCLASFLLYLKLLSRFARQSRLSHDNLIVGGGVSAL